MHSPPARGDSLDGERYDPRSTSLIPRTASPPYGEPQKRRRHRFVAVEPHVRPRIDLRVSHERPQHARPQLHVFPRLVAIDEDAQRSDDGVRQRRRQHEGRRRLRPRREEHPRVQLELEVLTDLDDAAVATLYRNAAFCLYPSRYEGYGLPVVEAFRHGKAVLASTGGAVPEVVGNLSPCLDPDDGETWRRMLQTWIEEPAVRALYEARIRTSFRHPGWDESAAAFFALARRAAAP